METFSQKASPESTDEGEQIRFREIWDDCMQKRSHYIAYKHTKVLLLSWSDSDLNQEELNREVEDLADVFRIQYNYEVIPRTLCSSKNPTKYLNKYLADFVYEHDNSDTLLIIYYAGHGWVDQDSANFEFHLTARNVQTSKSAENSRIAWHQVERILASAEEADILGIFDCCDAGSLINGRGGSRFEYLGACGSNESTAAAGPSSFTRALIWALKELRGKEKPIFSTSELQKKVFEAPNFPRYQIPVLGQRVAAFDLIMLAPTSLLYGQDPPIEKRSHMHRSQDMSYLDLRFSFGSQVSDRVLAQFALSLRRLTNHDEVPVNRIDLLQKRGAGQPRFVDAVKQVMAMNWLRKLCDNPVDGQGEGHDSNWVKPACESPNFVLIEGPSSAEISQPLSSRAESAIGKTGQIRHDPDNCLERHHVSSPTLSWESSATSPSDVWSGTDVGQQSTISSTPTSCHASPCILAAKALDQQDCSTSPEPFHLEDHSEELPIHCPRKDTFTPVDLAKSHKTKIVDSLVLIFQAWIHRNVLRGHVRTVSGSNQGSTQNSDGNSGLVVTSESTTCAGVQSTKRTGASGKRARYEDDGNEEDGRNPKKPKLSNNCTVVGNSNLPFACPYRKRRPDFYQGRKWRACLGPNVGNGWPQEDTNRLKQHLYDYHMLKPQCVICGEQFETQERVNEHQRQESRCPTREFRTAEGIDLPMKERLQHRGGYSKMTKSQLWKHLYMILFPRDDHERIPSPYHDAEASRPPLPADFIQYDFIPRVRSGLFERIPADMHTIVPQALEILNTVVQDVWTEYLEAHTVPVSERGGRASRQNAGQEPVQALMTPTSRVSEAFTGLHEHPTARAVDDSASQQAQTTLDPQGELASLTPVQLNLGLDDLAAMVPLDNFYQYTQQLMLPDAPIYGPNFDFDGLYTANTNWPPLSLVGPEEMISPAGMTGLGGSDVMWQVEQPENPTTRDEPS